MNRSILLGLLLGLLCAPAYGQGMGGMPGGLSSPGTKKSGDDLLQSANPGVAPALDIRIQGEGLSLPKGVAEDEMPVKPQAEPKKADALPSGTAKPEGPAK
jgi:hypothetical protein